jgi:DNA-binding response OmpR family regulator
VEKKMPNKILAIDDDLAMTELLAMLLKSHGFDVATANNGEDGLDIIRKENPDAVLLDLMMPMMDGWKVCSAIRSFSKVPIIILSALDTPSMIASALDAGADDYLVKPVPSGVLVAHINTLTRRASAEKNGSPIHNTAPLPKNNSLPTTAGWE